MRKIFDYFAACTHVISTKFGAHGMELLDGVYYLAADMNDFELKLSDFLADKHKYSEMALNARSLVKSEYSWKVSVDRFINELVARQMLFWKGQAENEVGIDCKSSKVMVKK